MTWRPRLPEEGEALEGTMPFKARNRTEARVAAEAAAGLQVGHSLDFRPCPHRPQVLTALRSDRAILTSSVELQAVAVVAAA